MQGPGSPLSPATSHVGTHDVHQPSSQQAAQDPTPRCLSKPFCGTAVPTAQGTHPGALLEGAAAPSVTAAQNLGLNTPL